MRRFLARGGFSFPAKCKFGSAAGSRPQALCLVLALLIPYGFFPTVISTRVSVPDSRLSSFPRPACEGKRLEERLVLSAEAASTYGGAFSVGRELKYAGDSVDSNDMCTPSAKPKETEKLPWSLLTLIAGGNGLPLSGPLSHPARCKISSICLSRLMDSSSPTTERNIYSVPLYLAKADTSSESRINNLRALSRANSAWAL